MDKATLKTSTIFVSTGRRTRVFRSMEEVPQDLRKRLHENIAGPNARTLIVADQRGREYLFRALKRASAKQRTIAKASPLAPSRRLPVSWNEVKDYWLEIGLVSLLGIASWALFHW